MAACHQCGFSLEVIDSRMGIVPQLTPPVSDLHKQLSRADRRRALSAVGDLSRRFPQVELSYVVTALPDQLPPAEYAFWLFNRAGISSTVERGGKNRRILLLVDSKSKHAVTMIGYGLEPFLAARHLQPCLLAAMGSLKSGEYGRGCEVFVAELTRQLQSVLAEIDRGFGVSDESLWVDSASPGPIQLFTPALV